MILRTIGSWALLTGTLLMLFILIGMTTGGGGDTLPLVVSEVSSLLLLIGLLALWTMLASTGRLGLIGLWCLGIGTGIALLVRFLLLLSTIDVGDIIPLSSALFGLVGSLLVGWVTVRARVFPSVIGWSLMVGGALNMIGGLLPAGNGTILVGTIAGLAQAGAFGGYGWVMLRRAPVAQRASLEQR